MLSYLVQLLFSVLPDTRLYQFKALLLRLRGFRIGNNVRVVSSVQIKLKHFTVGDNTFIGHSTLIIGGDASVKVGGNVDIAPRCVIVTGTHEIGDSTHRAGRGKSERIIIGDGTWIGAHSTILGGVCIGQGCVIAAGSLVREDIDDDCLAAGIPAQVIRKLA
jgi:acetyltransferase-like isoleucine patch superfamily enzyme